MNQKVNKNRGFSLIELLIAIAILAIIMVMISGFVSTTLHTQRKTKKDMQIQEEAQRIYSQFSDILMQASYVRLEAADKSGIWLDSSGKLVTSSSVDLGTNTFVPDNYPNYQLNNGLNSRKIIVDFNDFQLYNEADKTYPNAGCEIDTDDKDKVIKSFRALTQKSTGDVYHEYYYVKPKYIYIEYSYGDTTITGGAGGTVTTNTKKAYAILKYDGTKLYMYRKEISDTEKLPSAENRYQKAVEKVDAIGSGSKYGFISDNVQSFYLSANPDGNSFSVIMKVENSKYKGYMYQLKETVNMRNSNVLTVKPQLLRKRKAAATP